MTDTASSSSTIPPLNLKGVVATSTQSDQSLSSSQSLSSTQTSCQSKILQTNKTKLVHSSVQTEKRSNRVLKDIQRKAENQKNTLIGPSEPKKVSNQRNTSIRAAEQEEVSNKRDTSVRATELKRGLTSASSVQGRSTKDETSDLPSYIESLPSHQEYLKRVNKDIPGSLITIFLSTFLIILCLICIHGYLLKKLFQSVNCIYTN